MERGHNQQRPLRTNQLYKIIDELFGGFDYYLYLCT